MTNKYVLIKIAGIAFLFLIIIFYFLLYFIPTIKTISYNKRQLKDINLRIADFVKSESAFAFPNQEENAVFMRTNDELNAKLSHVKNNEDFIDLFTRVSHYISQQAEQDGIHNLVINSESKELKVNAGTLSSDKKTLDQLLSFSYRKLGQFRKVTRTSPPKTGISGIETLIPGITSHTITLCFTGELRNAMNFINHIPWGSFYLQEDKVLVSTGPTFPYYIVFLKIYYIRDNNTSTPGQG